MNDERTITRKFAACELLHILRTRPDWRHGYRLRYVLRMAWRYVICGAPKMEMRTL